ncbi:Muscleblind-like protein isoform 1 [Schistosoma japonicum]|uniref:Muscleblind-like protein isoform 1 n=2 Tax=Schistosoma japonicum TaxID=6182 RepID=A0A4Z2DFM2_SCHJA|nr:Muscleblind-like protein isoform 1 [Schistosoma japonicum]
MLHSPLSNSYPNNCSSTADSECNLSFQPDLTVLQSAIPFLAKPLLAIAGFPASNNIPEPNPTTFASQTSPQVRTHQETLKFGTLNSPNLSGSSSLSSSLVSLHSASNSCVNNQQISISPVSLYSIHAPSGSRDSRWLKLRVCTSILDTSNSSLQTNTLKSEKEPNESENRCSIKVEDSSTKIDCSATVNCQNENESNFHCAVLGNTCPYAHPPQTVRVDNGYVTVCYDFVKRKLCKFSYCKYYHPPPHQTEAIIKRGDEQKKLLESQQRLSDLKQTLPTGLSTFNSVASCPSSLRWPPTTLFHPNVGGSVYGTYLTPLNSVPDPTSLSASALIAAAAVLQHTNPGTIVLPTSSTLSTGSAFPHDSVISKSTINNNASFAVSPEKWLPAKRANLSTLSSLDGTSQNKEPAVLCNGDEKTESTFQNGDTKCHMLDSGTSFPTNFTSGSFNPEFTAPNSCTDIGTSHVDTEVANMLNPLNMSIYGLPFSSQPVTPLYTPSQFVYPPLYSINNSCDAPTSIASVAATLSLNNFILQQQQQQQLQSHQLLRTQLPTVSSQQLPGPSLYSSYVPSPTLVTAAALAAAQQPAHDVHTNTSSVAFQQQQQALLLSLILRSQQAQLAAAQIAAAGYLSQNDTSRLPSIPTLQNHSCILDSSCSVPGALVNLPSGPYGTNFCSQNPMTNVAYINEKGHLLETLPICRDFKAGKCRRNSDCRYVHLVDGE